MNLDTYLDRNAEEVNQAIVQFAARRSYRVRQSWYLEGLRIEAPLRNAPDPSKPSTGAAHNFLATLLPGIYDRRPSRIDVVLKRKRGRTRLTIRVGDPAKSIDLAYELQSYLQDDRAYDRRCPPMCPKCGSAVLNVQARYCGRCGQKLVAEEAVQSAAPVAMPPRPVPTVPEPEPMVASRPQAVPAPVPQAAPVVVERDVEPTVETAQPEAVTEPAMAQEEKIADADPPMPTSEPEQSDEETQLDEEEEVAEPEPLEEDRPRRALAED